MKKNTTPAISVQQPWAELIILGRKRIELRSWTTLYRGRLWLHTGKKTNKSIQEHFSLSDLYTGGFLGSVQLDLIIPIDWKRWEMLRSMHLVPGKFVPNLFGWVLSNPKRLKEPISAPGALRLFDPDPEIVKKLQNIENYF